MYTADMIYGVVTNFVWSFFRKKIDIFGTTHLILTVLQVELSY